MIFSSFVSQLESASHSIIIVRKLLPPPPDSALKRKVPLEGGRATSFLGLVVVVSLIHSEMFLHFFFSFSLCSLT
jgi:hypothetical protein